MKRLGWKHLAKTRQHPGQQFAQSLLESLPVKVQMMLLERQQMMSYDFSRQRYAQNRSSFVLLPLLLHVERDENLREPVHGHAAIARRIAEKIQWLS